MVLLLKYNKVMELDYKKITDQIDNQFTYVNCDDKLLAIINNISGDVIYFEDCESDIFVSRYIENIKKFNKKRILVNKVLDLIQLEISRGYLLNIEELLFNTDNDLLKRYLDI